MRCGRIIVGVMLIFGVCGVLAQGWCCPPPPPPVTVSITKPTDGQKFTFNGAQPGVLTIDCEAVATPSDYTDDIVWSCDDIDGTTESFSNSGQGGSVTLTLTTLPSNNSGFGDFKITASVAGASDSVTVKLFFPEEEDNKPGGGNINWFDYWKLTSAYCGDQDYDSGSAYGYTTYENGHWQAYLGTEDNEPYTPPDGDNKGNLLDGIDHFAWACRHEAFHMLKDSFWWPFGRVPEDDLDADWIPDDLEIGLGFNPEYPDTDGDWLNDSEDFTCNNQASWEEGSAKSEDWANPGQQF